MSAPTALQPTSGIATFPFPAGPTTGTDLSRLDASTQPDPDLSVRPYSAAWYERLKRTLGEITCRQLGLYAIPDDFLLSVVIPVYNEERTLQSLIDRVRAVPIRKEIIIVEDCSKDG